MPGEIRRPTKKTIVFRFHGGALNGEVLRSDKPSQGINNAMIYWGLSWKGTVGRRFDVSVPDSGAFERYKVASKFETEGEIHVTCEQVAIRH
jgi:hypothetical protein